MGSSLHSQGQTTGRCQFVSLLNNRGDAVVWSGRKQNGIYSLYFLLTLTCSSLLIKTRSKCVSLSLVKLY